MTPLAHLTGLVTEAERAFAGQPKAQSDVGDGFEWIVVEADRALYADRGRGVVLCDRLPSPVTLLLRVRRTVGAPSYSIAGEMR